jgi:endonuclease/exonuclease/phosphatase family metal-dependent hydrolase
MPPGLPVKRSIVTLTLAILAGAASAASPPRAERGVVRAVTFNLRHGGLFSELTGDDEAIEDRLRLVVEHLRALAPDVVGLQEASIGSRRGHVAARLAAALGYHHVHAPAAMRPLGSERLRRAVGWALDFREGPAILSRFPIARWQVDELPRCERPFDVRVLIFAELQTPAGRLPVFSAHTAGDPCHTRAVADLVRSRRRALPTLVMGDFNATETQEAIHVLTGQAGFLDAFRLANPAAPGLTDGQELDAPRATVEQRIDYVFLLPGLEVPGRVVGSRVVLDRPRRRGREALWASDHYGVLANIAVGPEAGPGCRGGRPRSGCLAARR